MSRRPPSSTLFPYTTLFRSSPTFFTRSPHTPGTGVHTEPAVSQLQPDSTVLQSAEQPSPLGRLQNRRVGLELDRKSTRLNSSHMSISYAVFCLKKKTNIKDE